MEIVIKITLLSQVTIVFVVWFERKKFFLRSQLWDDCYACHTNALVFQNNTKQNYFANKSEKQIYTEDISVQIF